MNRRILLDSGVLSLLTHPRPSDESRRCRAWLNALYPAGDQALILALTDYEVRREYLRRRNRRSIRHLEALIQQLTFTSLLDEDWRRAAALWATTMQQGRLTAPPHDVNIDVLLAAQAQRLRAAGGGPVIIATTNVRHLAPFADARLWPAI
jgi:predicted nucleic acid-binding protein